MCTFIDDRSAMVCDVAIDHVKQELNGKVGTEVSYTVRHGEGTLVEAGTGVDPAAFAEAVREGMSRI
jgi:hypothetical protein